jgi:ubiquinone biosynthesis protein
VSRLTRFGKITRVALRYRLDTLIEGQLPANLRWLTFPLRLLPAPTLTAGLRLRLALEALGPIFIKFGQMLSTRRDLLPSDIANELAKLQDRVPPFPEQQSIDIIEAGLGLKIGDVFSEFENTPMASASVAQVHAGKLKTGENVVAKVIRPGIEKIIEQDIALLLTLAKLVERYLPDGRRLKPTEVVNDYRITILDELDLQREAANTSQLKRNFYDSDLLHVPEVYWDYTNSQVFVMERIYGIPVTDIDTLKAHNIDLKALAERGVEIFFTQVFRDSFFHADMHPGNIFVATNNTEKPQYIAIDCAIIGSLSEDDQYYLARNLLAIFKRDYRQVAELHVECGWVPDTTPINEFESAMRAVCEPIFERPLGEISFGQLLIYLFQTARRFDMEIQPSLVLLQKTLLNIEGLGRQLYPQLDLWTTAQPFLEKWLEQRYSPLGVLKRASRNMPAWLEQLPHLPDDLLNHLKQSRKMVEQNQDLQQRIDDLQSTLKNSNNTSRGTGWVLACIATAAIIAQPAILSALSTLPAASWGLLALALLIALRHSRR